MTHGNIIHGYTKGKKKPIPEYNSWQNMIQRCHNPRNKNYNQYGGRGIKVHDEWRNNFLSFLSHIGKKENPNLTLDRIDNNGNYEPGNVRWATRKEQRYNQRVPVIIQSCVECGSNFLRRREDIVRCSWECCIKSRNRKRKLNFMLKQRKDTIKILKELIT